MQIRHLGLSGNMKLQKLDNYVDLFHHKRSHIIDTNHFTASLANRLDWKSLEFQISVFYATGRINQNL